MSWGEAASVWAPDVAVVAITVLAIAAVVLQPVPPARKYWFAALLLCGVLAIAAGGWQQRAGRAALDARTARLQQLSAKLDQLGRLLPAPAGGTPEQNFATVGAAIVSLNGQVKDLEQQVRALRAKTGQRTLNPDIAAKMAEDLRRAGSQRVVVSCAPDDVEAFFYANQLANVLRAAGWEALGPEATKIFGMAPQMGVRLYVRAGVAPPAAAQLLIDAFTRFNIPFESGITPSAAIPDPATTEIFVSHKP